MTAFLRSMIAATALVAVPALAQEGTVPSGAAAKEQSKVICRSSKVIGSRLSTSRTCKTATEWKQSETELQQDFDKMRRSSASGNGSTS